MRLSSSISSSSRELHVLLVQLHDAGPFVYAIPHDRIPLLILDSCASPVWPSESYKLVQAWACDSFWTQEHQPWGFVGTFRKGTAQGALCFGARASHCGGFSWCGAQALGCVE